MFPNFDLPRYIRLTDTSVNPTMDRVPPAIVTGGRDDGGLSPQGVSQMSSVRNAKTDPTGTAKPVTKIVQSGTVRTASTKPAPKTAPRKETSVTTKTTAKPAPRSTKTAPKTAPKPAPKTSPATVGLKPRVKGFRPYNASTLYDRRSTVPVLDTAPVGWVNGRVDWLTAAYHLAVYGQGGPGSLQYPKDTYYRTVSFHSAGDAVGYVNDIVAANGSKVLAARNFKISIYRNATLVGQWVNGGWDLLPRGVTEKGTIKGTSPVNSPSRVQSRVRTAPATPAPKKTAPKTTAKPAPAKTRGTRTK